MSEKPRSPIESGCPDGFQYMHPVMRKNYGQWKYHEHPKPGVLRHVAYSGDEIWTVRCGTQRILDIFSYVSCVTSVTNLLMVISISRSVATLSTWLIVLTKLSH